jgi:hypothetical protein
MPDMNDSERDTFYRNENRTLESVIYHEEKEKFDRIIQSLSDSDIPNMPNLLSNDEISQWIYEIQNKSFEGSNSKNQFFTHHRARLYFEAATDVILRSIELDYRKEIVTLLKEYPENFLV